ncbi:MAG: hypothetical protein VZR02_01095 [Lachnospiraceae bacterium]|nr:hypothetical protein [Lachnospiraceae bacterium]
MAAEEKSRDGPLDADPEAAIADWVRHVRFKKKTFGGVDEADVFKKIEELNRLYETLLLQERAKYKALLEDARAGGAADG